MRRFYCAICAKVTDHQDGGWQRFPRYLLRLWNCSECGATRSERR